MSKSNYLDNRFDNATRKNRKKMLTSSTDTDAKLDAQKNNDADIMALWVLMHPVFALFAQLYASWLAALGVHKGETLRLTNAMKDLSSHKIKQWDAAIRGVFLEDTEDYMILLPNKRKPFQSGTYEQRVAAVEGLGVRLASYPALATLKTDVDAFAVFLRNIRLVQQQKEQWVESASSALETQRVHLAVVMYRVLGFLMYKFSTDSVKVADFIDFSLLKRGSPREHIPTIFEHILPANSVDNITQDFKAGQEFEIEVVEGNGAFCYTADSKTQTYTGQGIFKSIGAAQKFTVSELGGLKKFMNVHNQNDAPVKIKITLVES
jgi:hypothetical protein